MDVISYSDPATFAVAARPVIERDPARASILATLLDQAIRGRLWQQAIWLLIVDDESRPLAAALQTPPYNVFLTPLPADRRDEAAGLLAETLQTGGVPVPGVTGVTADSEAFARAWTGRTGCAQHVGTREGLYEIVAPPAGPSVQGAARLATEDDLDLLTGWVTDFHLEAVPERAAVDGRKTVQQRLAHGWFLLWEHDGEPVSMAGLHPAMAGVSRIGPVYTPGRHRGRGYGSAVTAAATRLGFAEGADRCILYTDLANPTSNAIYQALGYRPLGDGVMIHFD